MGYATHDDQNGPWADGVFPTTFNVDPNGRRGSAALVYLLPRPSAPGVNFSLITAANYHDATRTCPDR
jgi:hypothetical protein